MNRINAAGFNLGVTAALFGLMKKPKSMQAKAAQAHPLE